MATSIASILEAERILQSLTAPDSCDATVTESDVLASAIASLTDLCSRKSPRPIDRIRAWELSAEIFQIAGQDGLEQAVRASGCSIGILQRWIQRLQDLRAMYPMLSMDVFEEAYRIIWYFSKHAPEHDLRFWLDLAQSHGWSGHQLMQAHKRGPTAWGGAAKTSNRGFPDEIIPWFHQYYQEHGRWPRSRDWEAWQPNHPDAPTLMQIRRRHGSWNNALRAAGASVHRRFRPIVYRSHAYLSIVTRRYRARYHRWPRWGDVPKWQSGVIYKRYRSWSDFIQHTQAFRMPWSRRWHVDPSRLPPDPLRSADPVLSDAVTNAIAVLTVLRSHKLLGPDERWRPWELASGIFQEAGRDGLVRAAQESGYAVSSLMTWAQTLSRFSPALRAAYPDLPAKIFEGAYRATQLFPTNAPEHDLRFWLGLAQSHHWNRDRLVHEAQTIQEQRATASTACDAPLTIEQTQACRLTWSRRWHVARTVPFVQALADRPTSSLAPTQPTAETAHTTLDVPVSYAFVEAVRAWRTLAAESLSVAERGALALEFQQSLADAVAVFNTYWSPYFLEHLTLTSHPVEID